MASVPSTELQDARFLRDRWSALALGSYALLTLAVIWRDFDSFRTKVISDGLDSQNFLWNLWWVRYALLELKTNPFFCSIQFYPEGTPLLFDSFTPLNGLLSIVLCKWMTPEQAFNVLIALTFTLSGWFFYLFARAMKLSVPISLIAGIWYMFGSFHVRQAAVHIHLASVQFIPLFLCFFMLGMRTGKTRWAFCAAIALLCNHLCDTFFVLSAVPIAAVLWVVERVRLRGFPEKIRMWNSFTSKFILFAIVFVGPLMTAMVISMVTNKLERGRAPELYRLDPSLLVVPGASSAWGGWFRSLHERMGTWSGENAGWLGAITIVGVVIGAIGRPRKTAPWLFVAISFFCYAVGPSLKLFGHETGLSTPYAWLHQLIPSADVIGTPVRFVLSMTIGLLVAAAIGWQALLEKWNGSRTLIAFLLVITLIELWPARFDYYDFTLTPRDRTALESIRDDKGDFCVLTAESFFSPKHKTYQIVHQKPIIGGVASRWQITQREELETIPLVATFYGLRNLDPYDLPLDVKRAEFQRQRIRYVISIYEKYHKLSEQVGLPLIHKGDEFNIYRVPDKF